MLKLKDYNYAVVADYPDGWRKEERWFEVFDGMWIGGIGNCMIMKEEPR